MKKADEPEITTVEKAGNAAAITFKNEGTTVYPANLLHATKDLATIMNDPDEQRTADQSGEVSKEPPPNGV